MSAHALLERHPALAGALPIAPLADLPTPITPLARLGASAAAPQLYMKRDDLTAAVYGGNKIRKLEFVLGEARRRGAQRVLTLGFAGSNHALATAICAQSLGMRSISMLLPQARSAYVRRNLLLGQAFGAELHACANAPAAVAATAATLLRHRLASGRWPMLVPPGGSSPLGAVGYVNAAFELQRQIGQGELPEPGRIYVAMGSMGTAAGLLVGLRAAGLRSKVVAVRVVEQRYGTAAKLLALARRVGALLWRADPHFPAVALTAADFEVRDEFFGSGYGVFTAAARAAAERLHREEGLRVDGTYSGKALAALMHDIGRGTDEPLLFWNTCSSRDLSARLAGVDYRALPAAFHAYFERPGQDWVGDPA